MKIYVKIGNTEPQFLEKAPAKLAQSKVESYRRHDRYEILTLGYQMPACWEHKYPEYIITK